MKNTNLLLPMIFGLALVGCGPEPDERGGEAAPMQPQTEADRAQQPAQQPAQQQKQSSTQVAPDQRNAFANINPASGSKVNGYATFTGLAEKKVEFSIRINDASPGKHAVHLHETGDCSAKDASSAGGHWNPTNESHGKRNTDSYHRGDIGNVEVGQDGKGSMTMTVEDWCIEGASECDVLGRAVIVHAGADDFTSQPAGNAGPPVGCGEVRRGHYHEVPDQQAQQRQ